MTHAHEVHAGIAASRRALGWVTLAGGALVLLFWALYFSNAVALGQDDRLTAGYESAFVLADALLAASLFAASHALLRGKPRGPFFLVVAAAMSLYLGLLDVTFYAAHGHYWPLTAPALVEIAVNALCLGGGAIGLRYGWTLWRARR